MDNSLTRYSDQPLSEPHSPQNPLLIAHRGLRGHYPLAIILAIVLAVPLGVFGYFSTKPLYKSTGLVRIEVSRIPLINQTELTDTIENVNAELQWHVAMLKSERVLNKAVSSDELSDAGWAPYPSGLRVLSQSLSVASQRNSDMISVSTAHRDRTLARIATDQILAAYMKIQDENANNEYVIRTGDLEDRVKTLTDTLDIKRAARTAMESEADLASLAYSLRQLDDYKAVIKRQNFDAELLIVQIESQLDQSGPTESIAQPLESTDPVDEVDVFALAENDGELSGLLAQRQALARIVAIAVDRFSPEHPERKRKEAQLRVVSGLVQDRVKAIIDRNPAILPAQSGLISKEAVLQQIAERKAILVTLQEDRKDLVVARDSLEKNHEEIADIRRDLALAKTRLSNLVVERESLKDKVNVGRAFIAQQGTSPLDPSTDRRIPLATAGTLLGACLGMGMISLLGIMRGGLRYIDDFESPLIGAPLLGCLPDLESDDGRANDMAALSVHHIRSMLEVRHASPDSSRTFLVTSPSAGDGKTSLSLSLASSFAIAGHKTVIVDGDLVGRGLTRELGLDLEPGLVDALSSGSLNGEVHETATPNLRAVPAGAIGLCTPEHLSTDHLRSFFASLRDEYDYVLVDTGPVLGSIEANVLAPLADDIILVVGKGRANRVVNASLERLERLNAQCCGVVFNRADVADFSRSVSTASLSVGSSGSSNSDGTSNRSNPKSLTSK